MNVRDTKIQTHTTVLHSVHSQTGHKVGVLIFTSIGLATAAWLWISLILG